MSDRLDPPLHGLAIYNPRLLSKEELVQTFVAREAELERIVDALRREVDAQPQHHLIVGGRGMGKTTLLNRLRYAIEDDEILGEYGLGLSFPEEQYNVGSLADFWLNCVDALADELEATGRLELLEGLDEEIAGIQALAREDMRRERGLALLCQLADRLGRRLVLLVDNVDLVLDRLQDEQWTLREVLSEERRIQLVGATSAPLESYYRHDMAFYDFFRVHHLEGLTVEETFTVLRKLAQATGNAEVATLIDEEPGRVKTVRVMAGGNPRTVVLLFSLLAQSTEGDVRADIERLLDLCTPLYKHRIDVLPTQAQRVLDALAMRWAPVTAAELAEGMHLKVNVVSAQLDRLVKDGTVEKVTLPDTKRLGFQVAERFFNIWCLMRASRRVRRRLVWLVEFLRLMFGPEELSRRARDHLGRVGSEPVRYAEMGLALADAVGDDSLRHALESRSVRELCIDVETRRRLSELLDLGGEDARLTSRVERMQLLAEARERVMSTVVEDPSWNAERFWDLLGGSLSFSSRGKHLVANASVRQLLAVLPILERERDDWRELFVDAELESLRGAVRNGDVELREPSEADLRGAAVVYGAAVVPCALGIIANGRLAEIGPVESGLFDETVRQSRSPLTRLAWFDHAISRGIPSADAWKIVDEIRGDQGWGARALNMLGNLLKNHLGRYEEAEAAYREAIERNPKYAAPWNGLGNLLKNHLGRYEEAEAAYREAIERDPSVAPPWNGLGILLQEHLGRYEEAEAAYREAIVRAPREGTYRANLAQALVLNGGSLEEAHALARSATEMGEDPYRALVFALVLVAEHRWADAEPWARAFIGALDQFSKGLWPNVLRFFSEVVTHRFIPQARRLLAETNLSARWEPLDLALALLERDELSGLGRLAPEMREAVTLVISKIAPDALDASS
ncbi:MAG: tetratricopeptide repeat protein [Myxococcales bacterium]|nr:tetratricopeptide repeat protein [Myxococcales bacterium]